MIVNIEVLRLWSIGVGSVIGGDFFGWQSACKGGYGAGLFAVALNSVLYGVLARCIAELSCRVPASGGAYTFVSIAIGPGTGLVVACLELMKLFLVLVTLGFGCIDYFRSLVLFPSEMQYALFAVLFVVFVFISLLGVRTSGNMQIVSTSVCLLVLLFYWVSMIWRFDFVYYAVEDNNGLFKSVLATLQSIPFGAWFFLGFEELPLLVHTGADELSDGTVVKSSRSSLLSSGLKSSFCTVFLSGVLTMTMASGGKPGVATISEHGAPLVPGMEEVYGSSSVVASVFGSFCVWALLTPFFSFLIYAGHHVQEVAAGGVLPQWAKRLDDAGTPVNALKTVGVVGFCIMVIFGALFGADKSALVLIPGCLLPAMLSSLLQLEALVRLHWRSNALSSTSRCHRTTVTAEAANSVGPWTSEPLLPFYVPAMWEKSFEIDEEYVQQHGIELRDPRDPISVTEIRFAQLCVLVVLVCVLVLAATSWDQFYGLLIVAGGFACTMLIIRRSVARAALETASLAARLTCVHIPRVE